VYLTANKAPVAETLECLTIDRILNTSVIVGRYAKYLRYK